MSQELSVDILSMLYHYHAIDRIETKALDVDPLGAPLLFQFLSIAKKYGIWLRDEKLLEIIRRFMSCPTVTLKIF
jgi:hypothetical protein